MQGDSPKCEAIFGIPTWRANTTCRLLILSTLFDLHHYEIGKLKRMATESIEGILWRNFPTA